MPSLSSRILEGFKSRWIRLSRWAELMAMATAPRISTTSSMPSPGAACNRLGPSTSCMAITGTSEEASTSKIRQTFGWLTRAWSSASRMKRWIAPG